MKRLLFMSVIVALGLTDVTSCSPRGKGVALHDFAYHILGETAPFSFELENHTPREVDVVVSVLAQSVNETRLGTTLTEVGREDVNVSLKPNEKKKITGQVRLRSSSSIVLSPSVTVKMPN